jgi:hypothetical protein
MQPKRPAEPKASPTAEELLATFKAGYQALGRLLELHREFLLKIVNEEVKVHHPMAPPHPIFSSR